MWTEHRFISFDETPIFYRRLRPENPKATVLILHGMGEHGGRYRELASWLGESGFESVLPDLRGFGQSGGRRAWVSHFSDYHRDLAALAGFLERTGTGTGFFLLGHSLGGLIASSYAAFSKPAFLKGLVLSSPLFGVAVPIEPWRHFLGMTAWRFLPAYTQPSRVLPETLTHDPRILEAYKRDPAMYFRITARLYGEMVHALRQARQIASGIQVPTLILQAGEDKVVDRAKTVDFFNHLASTDKELEIYPGLYHEIFNEIERKKVFACLSAWISKHNPL